MHSLIFEFTRYLLLKVEKGAIPCLVPFHVEPSLLLPRIAHELHKLGVHLTAPPVPHKTAPLDPQIPNSNLGNLQIAVTNFLSAGYVE